MSTAVARRPRVTLVLTLAVVCLLTLGVGVAAAHQFVTFAQRPVTADSDGTARVPVDFHNTDIAVLRLTAESGFELAVEIVDADRDEQATVILDLVAVARGDLATGVTIESGEVESQRVENSTGSFPAGSYGLILSTPNGVGDETELLVPESAAVTAASTTDATESAATQTATATAGTNATATAETDATAAATTGTATTAGADTTATATADERNSSGSGTAAIGSERDGGGPFSASFPTFLLALFGPSLPVVVLAVASRAVG